MAPVEDDLMASERAASESSIQRLSGDATRYGLVIVAGAGLSMGHPSSLPNWTSINNAFITQLALVVAVHTDGQFNSMAIANLIAGQRDEAGTAAPDLQAQFAEESLGEAYFELFQPLNIGTWNDGHAAIAAIARSGVVRAVVTTNFDRLIELACESAGVATKTYVSSEDVGNLKRRSDGAVPILKVHGSVDQRDSIVDTLRQRVLGRPEALEDELEHLFANHAVLIVGFSGADLSYDPKYLRLRAGALKSPSFTYLLRSGETARAEITELADAASSMRVVEGDLPDYLVELANTFSQVTRLVKPGWDGEMEFPGMRKATLDAAVSIALEKHISPVQATVVLASIAEAAGSSDAALQLLKATMPHHSRAGLLDDPAMPRQQRMIAEHLIELGFLHPELAKELGDDGALTALQVLEMREVRPDTEGLALEALALGLVGEAMLAQAIGLQALKESHEDYSPPRRADIICALARGWSLNESWSEPQREALRLTYETMWHFGDEPRRLRVGALYARFLIEAGQLDKATRIVMDATTTSRRLKISRIHNDLVAVGGRLHLAQGNYENAFRMLQSVYDHFDRSVATLRCAETLLPLREAAAALGDANLLARSAAAQTHALRMFPGLQLPYAASRTRSLCRAGRFTDARAAVADLTSLKDRWPTNMWINILAARLQQQIVGTDTGH